MYSNVLIPRPETEELVDLILLESEMFQPKNIIDIGTGSGCILLSILKEIDLTAVLYAPK